MPMKQVNSGDDEEVYICKLIYMACLFLWLIFKINVYLDVRSN